MTSTFVYDDAGNGASQRPARRPAPPPQPPLEYVPQPRGVHPAYRTQGGHPRQSPLRHEQARPHHGRFAVRPAPQRYPQPQDPSVVGADLYSSNPASNASRYPQSPAWPLPNRPPPQQLRVQIPPRSSNPPQRPQRSDSLVAADRATRSTSDSSSSAPPPGRISPYRHPQDRRPSPSAGLPPQLYPGLGQWVGDNYNVHPAQRPSVSPSSASRIPRPTMTDMPSPQMQYGGPASQDVRRGSMLSSPPSARKGPASYYPPIAPVPPIEEESDSLRGSAKSASTHGRGEPAGPSSAASNTKTPSIPDYYLEHHPSQGEVAELPSAIEAEPEQANERSYEHRQSMLEGMEIASISPSPEPVLVRQASLGKKGKPVLMTLKGSERRSIEDDRETQRHRQHGLAASDVPSTAITQSIAAYDHDSPSQIIDDYSTIGAQGPQYAGGEDEHSAVAPVDPASAQFAQPRANTVSAQSAHRTAANDEPLRSGTGLIDPSSSEAESDVEPVSSMPFSPVASPERPAQSIDAQVTEILGGLEKGGALTSVEATELKMPTAGLSDRANRRRPPRLDMDSVREAEARGSLTSLSDLIRRATRLASNLDNGKTASRLGMDWFLDDNDIEQNGQNANKRRSGASLSDMLASFPPPGLPTPIASRNNGRKSFARRQSKPLRSDNGSGHGAARKRTCCGLSLWLFVLIVVLVVILVAAAVVIPVVLVVVPKHQNHDSRSVSTCNSTLLCHNGGIAVQGATDTCQCLCTGGFSGSTCSLSTDGCTTAAIGSVSNATIGNALPPLINDAMANFSIPLNGDVLLDLFSSVNMSCNTQNALVTFNGQSQKRSLAQQNDWAAQITAPSLSATPTALTYEAGPTTSTLIPPPATATRPASTVTPAKVVTFARIAVLYVLQASQQLDTAIAAQTYFQNYFSSGNDATGAYASAKNVTLGSGFSVDLLDHCIHLTDGTAVGGT